MKPNPTPIRLEETKAAMIVVGEKSPAGMRSVGADLAHVIPGARLEILSGQGHMVAAKALLPLLRRFCGSAAAPLAAASSGSPALPP